MVDFIVRISGEEAGAMTSDQKKAVEELAKRLKEIFESRSPVPKSRKVNSLFITAPDAAKEIGLSLSTWRRMIREGTIRSFTAPGVRGRFMHRHDAVAVFKAGIPKRPSL